MRKINEILYPRDHKPDHFRSLDGLRGLAVIIVLLSHSTRFDLQHTVDFEHTGKWGVYLFFVLSSYLLDRQIIFSLKEGKVSTRYWMNYAVRRFLRIYPVYILALLLNEFLSRQGNDIAIFLAPGEIIDHLLLSKGNMVFWSIPVEFTYYILSPLLMVFFHHVIKWRHKLLLFSVSTLSLISITSILLIDYGRTSVFPYLSIFLAGSYIAYLDLFYQEKVKMIIEKNKSIILFFALGSLVIFILLIPAVFNAITGASITSFNHPVLFIPVAIMWSSLLLLCRNNFDLITPLFEFKFLRFFGIISYSVYLFHVPVFRFFANSSSYELLNFIFALLTVATLGFLMLFFFERHLAKIKLKK